MPENADDVRHKAQDAAGALELLEARPVLRQAVEELGMDRVGDPQELKVAGLAGLGRELGGVRIVEVVEGLDGLVARLLAPGVERLEQASADDLVGLVAGCGKPARMDAAEDGLEAAEGVDALVDEECRARVGACRLGLGDEGKAALAGDAPGEVAPEGVDLRAALQGQRNWPAPIGWSGSFLSS
jgi:hypothetical protein